MVDALTNDLFASVKAGIPEGDHHKFKIYEKEGAVIKDVKDQKQMNLLHNYVLLSPNVDMAIVGKLINEHGIDVKAQAHQKNNAMTLAAQNPTCKMATLKALAEMGLELNCQCEIQANVMMHYTNSMKVMDKECIKWLQESGNDIKHADKNKMNILHYTMLNFHIGVEEIKFLVECGADINAKMHLDFDLIDLVYNTPTSRKLDPDYFRCLTLTKWLVENMDITHIPLQKLVDIQTKLFTPDKFLMCKLRHHESALQGKKDFFSVPDNVFQHVTSYV